MAGINPVSQEDKSKRAAGVVIKPCTCSHSFQDKVYGKGQRVHNKCPKDKTRCTVCGK